MVKILVIGAGVAGLSTTACIQENIDDVEVTIMSELFPPEDITSMVAGGLILDGKASQLELKTPVEFACIMGEVKVKFDQSKAEISQQRPQHGRYQRQNSLANMWVVVDGLKIGREIVRSSVSHFKKLSEDGNSLLHGVREQYGYYLVGTSTYGEVLEKHELPFIAGLNGYYKQCNADEIKQLVPDHPCSGWHLKTYLVDSRTYLPYLIHKVVANGAQLVRRRVNSLEEVSDDYDTVVNCTGLGSRELVADGDMYPIKGQLTRLHTGGKIKNFLRISRITDLETNAHITGYVLPHGMDAVIGGTHESHVDTRTIEENAIQKMLNLAENFDPILKNCYSLGAYTGLRPVRSSGFRVEREVIDANGTKKNVIHNYGHGGRGYILSWGCASKAVDLVKEALSTL